jgi:hypothetical protein
VERTEALAAAAQEPDQVFRLFLLPAALCEQRQRKQTARIRPRWRELQRLAKCFLCLDMAIGCVKRDPEVAIGMWAQRILFQRAAEELDCFLETALGMRQHPRQAKG